MWVLVWMLEWIVCWEWWLRFFLFYICGFYFGNVLLGFIVGMGCFGGFGEGGEFWIIEFNGFNRYCYFSLLRKMVVFWCCMEIYVYIYIKFYIVVIYDFFVLNFGVCDDMFILWSFCVCNCWFWFIS